MINTSRIISHLPESLHLDWWHELRDYLMIGIGTCMYALGYTMFLLPYKLAAGGLSGVCAIIFYLTGIDVSLTYSGINVLLILVALKILGWRFCIKTMYGVACCTLWLWAWQRIIESGDGSLYQICGDERFMAVLLGAIIEGIALSICFSNHGSTGGTDIIAACVNKYKDVSLGQMILALDIFIISSCYFFFNDVQMVIFGYVLMAVASITLDYFMRWMHQSVEFKIFSRNYSNIADAIVKAGFGLTVVDGKGWYTQTERKMLVCIVSKRHSTSIARIVKRVDPYAFLSVTNVEGVYGEGFDTMKTKVKGQKPIIVFATNNAHKLEEVRQILNDRFEVRSLKDIGCTNDLPETHCTLEENALEKARYIKNVYGYDCFADDTGLEVTALNGAPGVYSARYATIAEDGWEPTSEDHDSQQNMNKLLTMLEGKTGKEREARFRTVIALIKGDKEYQFEGIVEGDIATERHGTDGFGYDPIFRPEKLPTTFAEMSAEEKNNISHRGRAVEKLAQFLLS